MVKTSSRGGRREGAGGKLLRYLRIVVTALSLAVSVLLVALWVRSYWLSDIYGLTFDSQKRWNFCSAEGRIFLGLPNFESAIWAFGERREWDIRSGKEKGVRKEKGKEKGVRNRFLTLTRACVNNGRHGTTAPSR